MTKPRQLTDTHLVLLSSAAQHDDQLVVLPEKLNGGAAKASISKLLSCGLLQEMQVTAGEPHWRKDESDRPVGLRITRAGLLAIGIEPEDEGGGEQEAEAEEAAPPEVSPPTPARSGEGSGPARAWVPREGSKQALVLSLLSRPEGATIDDLLSATVWLAHTTRAALTGLRQKGYEFTRSKNEAGQTVYKTVAPEEAAGEPTSPEASAGEGASAEQAAYGAGDAA